MNAACLFCNQPVPITGGHVSCKVCDKHAIAKRRLEADEYERDGGGTYTSRGAWLREVDLRKAAEVELP